jgi:hypothetical protein
VPSFQESFLGKIPSVMLIVNDTVKPSENLGVILGYEFAERFGVSCLRSLDQL